MQPAPSLSAPSRSQASQASLYAFNAAESAAHNRPSITGEFDIRLARCDQQDCLRPAGHAAPLADVYKRGVSSANELGAVTALLNDLAALVSRRARRRRQERLSGISEGAAGRVVALDSHEADATGDEELQKVCYSVHSQPPR